jgi:LmbE family N-acetylglucosaminyl deacetylase
MVIYPYNWDRPGFKVIMIEPLKLLAVFPHPDDESLGLGGTLAKYSAEGAETYLICATRGERGWNGPETQNPGLAALGHIREAELSYLSGGGQSASPIWASL